MVGVIRSQNEFLTADRGDISSHLCAERNQLTNSNQTMMFSKPSPSGFCAVTSLRDEREREKYNLNKQCCNIKKDSVVGFGRNAGWVWLKTSERTPVCQVLKAFKLLGKTVVQLVFNVNEQIKM